MTGDVSPIAVIEHAVQDRARLDRIGADGDGDAGDDAIRQLIEEEVQRWQDDFRRGHRSHELVDPDGLAERAFRNIARHGPLTSLLEDDDVWEVMVNAPDGALV